jgi:hypothetical protein
VLEWLEPSAAYLGNAYPAEAEPTPTDLERVLQEPAQKLANLLRRVIATLPANEEINLDPQTIDVLRNATQIFSNYVKENATKRVRAPFLYQQVEQIIYAVSEDHAGKKAIKYFVPIFSLARAIQRIICAYDLRVAMFTIHEMKQQANALHGFYAYNITTKETSRLITVYELIQSIIQENAPLAASRRVELRPTGVMNLKVEVRKRDMIRALSQLLRNAIKYNYSLDNYPIWVDIRCYKGKHGICIDVENWGYPITSDEIKRGTIFQVGRRGTFAARSNQPGYGIGLADAKRIIEDHGGNIDISSVPARKTGDTNDYRQPFITTVTVTLVDPSNINR